MKWEKSISLIISAMCFVSFCSGQRYVQPEAYKKYNPSYHFYPSGDPTGLFFYDLLYYNNWGTATSSDLVHWKYTQAALNRYKDYKLLQDSSLPAALKDSIRKRQIRLGGSGTIVVDWNNTSGFGKNGRPPLISLWHNGVPPWDNQVVGIAYSNDTAKTWIRYEKFPVLDINSREFRDPKVFWYEPEKKWIMVIGWAEVPKIKFFSSSNLKDWTFMSDFGPWGAVNGVWECADFFPLPVDGNEANQKWVLAISVQPQNVQYFIGDFDGKRFLLDSTFKRELSYDPYLPKGSLLFDFEHGIDDWNLKGDAFLECPATQALFQQGAIMGKQGHFFITSFHDRGTGTGSITSPAFIITKNYISFLVGGNYAPGEEAVNLIVDGKIVRTQTGNNSGGLQWTSWDVSGFRDKQAKIEISDKLATAAITVDHILLTDEPADTERQKAFWVDHGSDFFAVRSWNNYPQPEKRIIWTAWMGSWRYGGTEPVPDIQTIPREVQLKTFPEGIRLLQNPIKELQTLRGKEYTADENIFEGLWTPPKIRPSKNTYELLIEFENQDADEFGLKLCTGKMQKTVIGYSVKNESLYVDRRNSGLDSFIGLFKTIDQGFLKNRDNTLTLHVFVDHCSIEVFGNNGETVLSSKIYPDPESVGVEVFSSKGKVKVKSFHVWDLSAVDTGLHQ